MRKILALLMLTLSLTACATTSSRPLTEADLALRRINEERMRNAQRPSAVAGLTEAELATNRVKEAREQEHREQMGYESATVTKPGPSTMDVIGAIIALPIVIPLAAMVEYGRGPYSSVHCRSWTYKDQYHASCY